jgi:hypothetical protein
MIRVCSLAATVREAWLANASVYSCPATQDSLLSFADLRQVANWNHHAEQKS